MRGTRMLSVLGSPLAALAAMGGINVSPVRVSRGLGPDGNEWDAGRTVSKITKRLAHLPERYAQAHQAKRKQARSSAKKARRAA